MSWYESEHVMHLKLNTFLCNGFGVHTIALQRSRRSVRVSEMLTWTMRLPSSTRKTRSSAVHEPHNCSSPFWSPARRFAAPDRGSRCSARRAWESVFCSVCPRVGWGWSCAGRRTPRSGTACVAVPAHSPWRAASAGPRRTAGFRRTFCLFFQSLVSGCPSPLRFFDSLSFFLCCASAVCRAPLHCYRDCPPGIPGNLTRLASPLPRTSPTVRLGSLRSSFLEFAFKLLRTRAGPARHRGVAQTQEKVWSALIVWKAQTLWRGPWLAKSEYDVRWRSRRGWASIFKKSVIQVCRFMIEK